MNVRTAVRFVRCWSGHHFQYWFFQRVLRINSGVPWAVHHSSIVDHHEKILFPVDTPMNLKPGFMPGSYISGLNGIILGRNVWLGPGVSLVSCDHCVVDFNQYMDSDPIKIGDNCWLGANVVILPSVVLGAHTVVGANAVVTHSFQDGDQVVAGVPARIVKRLPPYSKQKEVLEENENP